ncbi:hypothetical protein HW555_012760 [Spodoptera exigua]|uniref:Chitin-binding type-2 domain-containing protein n=1 Tax=Spodoptera exigua TaxID=7107 RepID=A0A835G5Z3_SPOEX|nr:hypothetical protein HW555_012760 [Spodoptera exigua]
MISISLFFYLQAFVNFFYETVTFGQVNSAYEYYGSSNVRDQRPEALYAQRPLGTALRVPGVPVAAAPAPVYSPAVKPNRNILHPLPINYGDQQPTTVPEPAQPPQDKAYKYLCPDGLHFNPAARRFEYPCAYPSEVKCTAGAVEQIPKSTDQCPNQYGYYAIKDGDCSKYIMCQEGAATIMECPMGLVFNPQISSCDWPSNVPQCSPAVFKDFICPEPPKDEDGKVSDIIYKYRYGNQCKQYIACQLGHPRLLSCEGGLSFDESSQSCIDEDYVSCAAPYSQQ